MNKLELKNVSKEFDGIKALDDVSFDLENGSIAALIGPNGAGKTTAFNIITGFVKADEGEVYFNARRISDLPAHVVARLGIVRTFQNIRLIRQMSVIENVLLAFKTDLEDSLFSALLQSSGMHRKEGERMQKAIQVLELVGLAEKKGESSESLSHGQRKMLEIARAVASEPKLLLLDEPFAGLFPSTVLKVMQIMRTFRDRGMTILFIEHNMNIVNDLSDRVIVLDYGKKIAEGKPFEILKDQRVFKAYLGTKRRGPITAGA